MFVFPCTVSVITVDNQQDATISIYLLLISSTCFGRCFRPSSGAYHCNYGVWYCIFCSKYIALCYIVLGDALYCVVLYCIVSGDVFAHHQAHITVTTASVIVFFVVKILYCVILLRAMHCIILCCFGRCFCPLSGAYH